MCRSYSEHAIGMVSICATILLVSLMWMLWRWSLPAGDCLTGSRALVRVVGPD
jgi:hypothetical protein